MKDISHHILNMLMFKGITEKQLIPMLKCLGSRVQDFKKGEFIYLDRDNITCIGIILSGTVQMIKEDIWGDKTILVVMRQPLFCWPLATTETKTVFRYK